MFGIEISNLLIQSCIDSGGYGYLKNNEGKPVFSLIRDDDTVGIIKTDSNSNLTVPDDIRLEMNEHNLPFTIVGKNRDHSKSFLPDRYFENVAYKNRVYIYGLLDCYTLIRDYFRDKHNVWIPANIDRAFGWWNSGKNLYVDMYKDYGFLETTEKIKKEDVLLFQFDNGMPSHSAIYIGDGMMMHHMIGRFSCIEKFDGIYKMSLAGVLRYGQ